MSLATDKPVTKASFWRKRLITFSCLHAYNYCQTQAAQGDGWIAQSENLAWMTGVQFKPPSISPTLIVQMNWLSVSKDKSNIWVICNIAFHKHSPKNLAGEVFDKTVNFLSTNTPPCFSTFSPPTRVWRTGNSQYREFCIFWWYRNRYRKFGTGTHFRRQNLGI